MRKHSRAEEGHLAAVFLAGSLIIAVAMSLRHDTSSASSLMTFLLSVTLLLTCILAGAWSGAWIGDLRAIHGDTGKWAEAGALAGFSVAIVVIFRNFI